MGLRFSSEVNRIVRDVVLLPLTFATLVFVPGCGGGASKTTPAKHAFAVSKSRITLNKKSAQWPLSYPTAKAMLGKPDRTTKVDVIDTTIYTWDKHGVTAHQEDGSKEVSISFWFHDNAGHFKWCPYETAKAVVIEGVTITSTSGREDLEKAGFVVSKEEKARLDFKLGLGRVGVTAQYHTDYLPPIENHGFPQFRGLDNIGVGDE
jgi:hypothetical protein